MQCRAVQCSAVLVLLQAYTVGVLVTFFDQAVVVQVLQLSTLKSRTIWTQQNQENCVQFLTLHSCQAFFLTAAVVVGLTAFTFQVS